MDTQTNGNQTATTTKRTDNGNYDTGTSSYRDGIDNSELGAAITNMSTVATGTAEPGDSSINHMDS